MQQKINPGQYIATKVPRPEWVLIKKDKVPQKVGSIFTASSTRERLGRWSNTGIVVAKCPSPICSDRWSTFLYSNIPLNKRVGFNGTHPVMAPVPLFIDVEGNLDEGEEAKEDSMFVMIHMRDLLDHTVLDNKDKDILKLYKTTTLMFIDSFKEEDPGLYKYYMKLMEGA